MVVGILVGWLVGLRENFVELGKENFFRSYNLKIKNFINVFCFQFVKICNNMLLVISMIGIVEVMNFGIRFVEKNIFIY